MAFDPSAFLQNQTPAQAISSAVNFVGNITNLFTNNSFNITGSQLTNSRSLLSSSPYYTDPGLVSQRTQDSVNGSESLIFPTDYNSSYFCTLNFYKYVRANVMDYGQAQPQFSIILPIPSNLNEIIQLNYDPVALGPLAGPIADIVGRVASGRITSPGGLYNELKSQINSKGDAALGGIYAGALSALGIVQKLPFVGDILGNVADIATTSLGAIPNPHLALVFRGVNLKQYQFNWDLVAYDSNDSQTLRNILIRLKASALPSFESGSISNVLDYPLMCVPQITPLSGAPTKDFTPTSNWIKFKRSMITSVVSDFTSKRVPAFHAGTHDPVNFSLQLNFQEIEIHTSQDYSSTINQGGALSSDLGNISTFFGLSQPNVNSNAPGPGQ